ncbi:MAG: acyl-CoA/acyl-ACP dehydrogenase [Nitrospinaceae bacterium]|jgi:alkylation response protein AidB-like acyl-CoA dehydrogenase|nr:acyl-CoA/acyl-ACP dehydrogenase [Nitrospinaceae bacterium]MBT3432357.1 acyl-CoA/acyl-ACP dehydrogenase [Nitrospinaceae bacterium]MBT4431219.1 acyl-CoA/acyl-ACP dehydrogenase [Nitrospinaceae bacterium]MBT6395641.1 acyl-CoA/acyl-ACP dehydrogenase [Nitrospinaceae bacterium]MBT7857394.1 acyl-CoA/acyl-ACP dehydrogenase [Nitrospinaceae bacterium]
MDFTLTEAQKAIQTLARDFVNQEVEPVAAERDRITDWEERMPWDLVEKASALGLRQLPFPEKWGGAGADVLTCCIAGEELAVGDLGFAVNLDQTWKLAHILESVEPSVRDPWIERLCKEPRFLTAIAITEPGVGSDHQGLYDDPSIQLNTRAEKKGGKWVINGMKHYISNGPCAELYVVAARTDMSKNLREGLSGFLVPRQAQGFSTGRVHEKVGQRLSMNSELFFENVEVPEEHLILGEGRMWEIRGRLLSSGKPEAAANCVGVGRAAFEKSLAHSRERFQGGKLIGEHQSVAAMLADMAIGLDLARTMVYRSAWAVNHQDPYDFTLGWKAKVFASEVAFDCARWGVEIFGGAGIMQAAPMEKYLRDASTFLHSDGTNQVLRQRVAKAYYENKVTTF